MQTQEFKIVHTHFDASDRFGELTIHLMRKIEKNGTSECQMVFERLYNGCKYRQCTRMSLSNETIDNLIKALGAEKC